MGLQKDLDTLYDWSSKWLLKFHPNKCKSVTISRTGSSEREYHLYDNDNQKVTLERTDGEKDIGVLVDKNLNFRKHIQAQISKANSIMGLIRRTYSYLDETNFKYLFKALVRPHLEYAATVWNPHGKQEIEDLENVQRRATRQLPSLKGMSYPERLKKLKMPTLKYRRTRGDMIETYKILNNCYDSKVSEGLLPEVHSTTTRGNERKLQKRGFKKDIRKYSFTQRVVNTWNDLPNSVIQAKTIKSFEAKLDKYWENQDMLYDHKVDLEMRKKAGNHKVLRAQNDEEDMDKVAGDSQRP